MDFLRDVGKRLDLPPAERDQVLRELSSHYEELKAEFVKSGMDDTQAASEAAGKLGSPQEIASRLQVVHMKASWKGAFLTVLPLLGWAVLSILGIIGKSSTPLFDYLARFFMWIPFFSILLLAFAVLMIAGSIRELLADRRPIWLATWLPMGIIAIAVLLPYVARPYLDVASHTNTLIDFIVSRLALWLVVVWAYRNSRTWMGIFTGLAILSIMVFQSPFDRTVAYCAMISEAVLVMAIAVKLFGLHRYGSIHQVSLALFIFSSYIPNSMMPGIFGRHYSFNNAIMVMALCNIIIVATILAFTRSSTLPRKIGAISTSVVVSLMSFLLFSSHRLGVELGVEKIMHSLFSRFSREVVESGANNIVFSLMVWGGIIILYLIWIVGVPFLILHRRGAGLRNTPPVIRA